MDRKTPSAEDHFDANPNMASAFALALANMGVPIAKFLQHTNSALATFAQDPSAWRGWQEIMGSKPIGEKRIFDTEIVHPTVSGEVSDYIQRRYGER